MERNEKTGEMREIRTAGTPAVNVTDYGLAPGTFSDLTGTLKRTGNNVGKDTNNP